MNDVKLTNGEQLLQYTNDTLSKTEMNVLHLNSFQLISMEKQFSNLSKQEIEMKVIIDKVLKRISI